MRAGWGCPSLECWPDAWGASELDSQVNHAQQRPPGPAPMPEAAPTPQPPPSPAPRAAGNVHGCAGPVGLLPGTSHRKENK